MPDAEKLDWYVVHTYSGYENKVMDSLKKTVDNRGLQDKIDQIEVPVEEVIQIKDGKRHTVQRKLFPGYVLVHMVMNNELWYIVRNTRGCTGFVGPQSKPVPLSEEEAAAMLGAGGTKTSRLAARSPCCPAPLRTSPAPSSRSTRTTRSSRFPCRSSAETPSWTSITKARARSWKRTNDPLLTQRRRLPQTEHRNPVGPRIKLRTRH